MICRLCLKDTSEVVHIFDEVGVELNVANVLKKYFWFEPKVDDPISTAICNTCWVKVTNFHEYYLSVEEAHRLLAERFIFKATSVEEENDIIEKVDESIEELKEEGEQQELSWEIPEINYNYTFEDEEEKPEEISLVVSAALSEEENENEESKEDIKPTTTEWCDALEAPSRRSTLRKRASSRIIESPVVGPSKRLKISKVKDSDDDIVQEKKISKYNIRAKESDLLIAKHMKLTCELCHQELPDFTSLRQHFENVHGQKGYVICCNKKLFKRVLLVDHINKHLDPEYFKCHDCNKVFADKQCLKNHMLIMHQADEEKPFECEHCGKRFIKQYLRDQHVAIHVPMDERKFPCDICPKVFPNEITLNAHRKNSHTHENSKMCHICAKVIRGRAMFEKHQLEHAGVKQPQIQCEKCGSWLKNKQSLQKHLRRHNEEGEIHKCNTCGKVAPNQSALRSHIRYVHASERTYACGVCDKTFKKALNLKEHMTTHTGEVLYSCPHCTKTFNSNANMHSHRKKVHPDEWEANRKHRKGKIAAGSSSKQKAEDSGNDMAEDENTQQIRRYFPSENTLNTHRKNTHTHEYGKMCHICAKVIRGKAMFEKHQLEHAGVIQPEVQCDKCGSWLKNKHSLQKHMRRHNEEGKLHTCNICGKVAPNQSALRSHIRYVHASERVYECSVCDKAFKKALNLKEHMTTHTGEVLYSCPHCTKTFNSNANMHSHRKKVHPEEWEANRKHRKGKIAAGSSRKQNVDDSSNDMAEDENIQEENNMADDSNELIYETIIECVN